MRKNDESNGVTFLVRKHDRDPWENYLVTLLPAVLLTTCNKMVSLCLPSNSCFLSTFVFVTFSLPGYVCISAIPLDRSDKISNGDLR
jgi:MFS superfamily sulfate permease-like transporter